MIQITFSLMKNTRHYNWKSSSAEPLTTTQIKNIKWKRLKFSLFHNPIKQSLKVNFLLYANIKHATALDSL